MNKLRMWLDSAGKDPREAAMKARLRTTKPLERFKQAAP